MCCEMKSNVSSFFIVFTQQQFRFPVRNKRRNKRSANEMQHTTQNSQENKNLPYQRHANACVK